MRSHIDGFTLADSILRTNICTRTSSCNRCHHFSWTINPYQSECLSPAEASWIRRLEFILAPLIVRPRPASKEAQITATCLNIVVLIGRSSPAGHVLCIHRPPPTCLSIGCCERKMGFLWATVKRWPPGVGWPERSNFYGRPTGCWAGQNMYIRMSFYAPDGNMLDVRWESPPPDTTIRSWWRGRKHRWLTNWFRSRAGGFQVKEKAFFN